MGPKLSDDSDDSQPSLMDTEAISRSSESPINHPEINSSSRGNSLTSPSSSTSTSPLSVPYRSNQVSNFNNKCKSITQDLRLVNSPDEKVNFDSVSSSPESEMFHRDSRISHNQQITVPRTMPCIVLSPSTHQFFNPGLYNPSLIMPLPMFQSQIMGKMTALSSKNTDSGLQRFRDFCADQNSNPHLPTSIKNPYEETMIQKEFIEAEKHEKPSETATKRLSFGIDRILSDENSKPDLCKKGDAETSFMTTGQSKDPISKRSTSESPMLMRQPILHPSHHLQHHHNHHHHPHQNHHNPHNSASPLNLSRCSECYILGRYCRNNHSLQYSSLASVSATPGGSAHGVSASFSPSWMSNASIYENTPLLSPSAYSHSSQSAYSSAYGLSASGYSTMSSLVSCNTGAGGRRKRSWSRAVFSSLQRKGLEKRFQIQKYITKPDRRQLAATLGLTDAQVKVWFQNRRMKWRHSKEGKVTSGVGDDGILVSTASSTTPANGSVSTSLSDTK